MIPPERGGFKREANAPAAQLSAVQKVVRYVEKDDVLLYITAGFGILMPALMYLFYRTVHAKYMAYNAKRKASKRKEKEVQRKTRTTTIFYCGSASPTKRVAYDLAENLDQFDPIVSNLSGSEIHRLKSSKALLIFVVEQSAERKLPESLESFLDFLDQMRYEHRRKDFMKGTSFAVYGIGHEHGKISSLLHGRLKSLQGTPILDIPQLIIDTSLEESERLNRFSSDLSLIPKQFYYGAFDTSNDKSTEEYETEEDPYSTGSDSGNETRGK